MTRGHEPPILDMDIREAEDSDRGGMQSIFRASFEQTYPRLWHLMYQDSPPDAVHLAVDNILNTYRNSQDCKFLVAYDVSEGTTYDFSDHEVNCLYRERVMDSHNDSHDYSDIIEDMSHLTYGVIALSVARSAAARNLYTTSDLRTHACLKVLEQARATGEVHQSDSRVRLLDLLEHRSIRGQDRRLSYPYLVVNALLFFPGCHRVTLSDMASQLIGWAVASAEREGMPIWTQVPADEKEFFLQAGFTEIGRFTLELNHFKPHGSRKHWGTQDWVQMVYYCRHR